MTKPSAKNFFNNYADDFSDLYGRPRGVVQSTVNKLFRRSMKRRFKLTLEECQPLDGCRVLDLGCGPGHYAIELARRGGEEVVGLDFAPRMIELAERRAREAGVGEKCKFACADVMTFPTERPFDYTVAMGLTDYIADIHPLLIRIAEVTKRKAVISFPKAGGVLAWQRGLRYRKRCDLYLYSRSQIEQALDELSAVVDKTTRASIKRIGRDFFVVLEFLEEPQ